MSSHFERVDFGENFKHLGSRDHALLRQRTGVERVKEQDLDLRF